jgi:hypothetical protein
MKNVFFILLITLSLFSCNKEQNEPDKSTTSAYLPMAIGNYWVYQEFELDSVGIENTYNILDSIIISKDTTINGVKYLKFDTYVKHPDGLVFNGSTFCRDSLKYLVRNDGKILFSEDNFVDTLTRKYEIYDNDTLYTLTCKMEKKEGSIQTPAGAFSNLLNFKQTVLRNPKYSPFTQPTYNNNYYAEGIGKIFGSSGYFSTISISTESRLLRYKIVNNEK